MRPSPIQSSSLNTAAAGAPGSLRVWLACDWFVKYTAGLAQGLAQHGCGVVLVTRDHDEEFGGKQGAMRDFVSRTLAGRAQHLELPGRVRDRSGPRAIATIRGVRWRWQPDVVHVQDSISNDPRLWLASSLTAGRYALTIHDPLRHPGDRPPSQSARLLQRILRRRAGLVFVHSERLADEVRSSGVVSAPIEVVPHGIGEGSPSPLPRKPRLLFFGRISHYKGLDTLFEAMPLVWDRQPEAILTVAGEGQVPAHPVLADRRIELRPGHVPEAEVPGLFRECTCVVLPYRQASQSGVGSLAKQFGRPVVATRTGGLSELVDDRWGRLAPPEDPVALAAAIAEVLGTPGLAEEMA
ncbi:MAG TPA: glycosyltransferase family 4 protein, partial [Gemmatimonadales bacterium]|nr:glycosyltransferase family 4 protein [Gemmatimonadales bacterium]